MIGGRRPLQGRKPGDRRVRVERPHTAYFRYTGPGQLVAPRGGLAVRGRRSGRAFAGPAASLFGRPLSNYEEIEERLPKKKALAIFSSDPISSSAYATEEILRVLVLAGAGALLLSLPDRRRRSPCCWRSSRRAIARSATPTRPAAAPTPWRARTCRAACARRGRRPARRLRHDRRRVDLVGGRADHVGRARSCCRRPGRDRRRARSLLITVGQPARPARVGQHLRDPDVPVRRARRC